MSTTAIGGVDNDFQAQLMDYGLSHDPVTGLPNRRYYRSWIGRALTTAAARGEQIALLWIDILNLKREYMIAGDEGSERMALMVADSLRPGADQGELVCRVSDRCFLVALKRDDETDARLTMILDAAAHRSLHHHEGKPELSAGVSYFPEHTSSPDELTRFASIAADLASRMRSRTAVIFRPEMNASIQLERDLERDLRVAMREGQLTLAYQPQIDLVTGTILGVEGLTRWNHPTRGAVSPAQFIPLAERSNLIDELFTHSLRRLLTDVDAWRKAGVVLPSAAVNASPANVRHQDFVSMVKHELAAHPPGATQLDVEVTESLLMDDEALFIERLTELRAVGVKVSLDDFGTRYTGFNALKGLPLNTMKIDRCFVHGIDRSRQAQALCRTIVTMARHLGLSTVAEGIEEAGELKTLKELGCHGGQGYLFQRPVAPEQFLEFMRQWPERKLQSEFGGAFLNVDVEPSCEVDPLYGVI